MNTKTAHTETYTYGAATSSYVVFGVMCGVVGALGMWAKIASPSMPWVAVLIPVICYVFACIWLSRYRLSFLADRVSYSSLFARERSITYRSIAHVGLAAKTTPYEGPLTVSVKSVSGEEVRINAKVFPRQAVQRLMAIKYESHELANDRT
jgi:hypothetical protein